MEIDAATEFTPNWDTLAIQQWSMTQNEYAVLSTVPLSTHERDRIRTQGNSVAEEVPRQCSIKIGSEGVPVRIFQFIYFKPAIDMFRKY